MASFIICSTASGKQRRHHVCQPQWGYSRIAVCNPTTLQFAPGQQCLHISHTSETAEPQCGASVRGYFRNTATLHLSCISSKIFATEVSPEGAEQCSSNISFTQKLGLKHLCNILLFLDIVIVISHLHGTSCPNLYNEISP